MEQEKHALVLTGAVVAGFDTDTAWAAAARYFRMDEQRLRNELLARAPVTIKEGEDLAKLETLQAGAAAVGAETEIHRLGTAPKLFALVGNSARGPMPLAFISEQVRRGAWPGNIQVAEVGSSTWQALDQLYAAAALVPPSADFSSSVFESSVPEVAAGGADQDISAAVLQPESMAHAQADHINTMADAASSLPAGAAIHAGFWRRCAALVVDSLLLGVFTMALAAGMLGGSILSLTDENALAQSFGLAAGFQLLAIVLQWLYGALFESSAMQATPGKRLMGLKVTDDCGHRIGFGRATARHFGKIVSGLILYIGFMLAGWTARKQGLHDMMASCCVVFRNVQPGQPMPTDRPPMPWYGWLLNLLVFVLPVLFAIIGVLAGMGEYSGRSPF